MKWAVCLSGHLRTWKRTVGSFQRYIQRPYRADVFAHTWTTVEFFSRTWWREQLDRSERLAEPHTIEAELSKHYNLKGFLIEDPIDFSRSEFEDWNKDSYVLAENVVSMLYSASRSHQLLRDYEAATGTEYDMIVKTRPDIQFFDQRHLKSKDHDILHVMRQEPWHSHGGVGDLFGFGPSEKMEVVFNFFDHIDDYLKPENFHSNMIVPEILLGKFLRDQGIEVKHIDMTISVERSHKEASVYPCLPPTS